MFIQTGAFAKRKAMPAMSAPYFFLRPLLAPDRAWAAFEWKNSRPDALESHELLRCFTQSGAASLADSLPLLVPGRPDWLAQPEFIQKFAPHQAIFVLNAETLNDPQTGALCQELRKRGRHCALRIDRAESIRRVPLAAFDYLVFDAENTRQTIPPGDLLYAAQAGLKSIALGVSSAKLFDWLLARHFALGDGRFVSLLDTATEQARDLLRLKLLKLLSLVAQDADTHEIEAVFREEPKLSYNLLRLVNSVAIGARAPINSFSQAIALLGRRQLQRWLQLLIYANQGAGAHHPNPLMQLAAARGREMELLSAAIDPQPDEPGFCDAAFMTGIFSLLDVLLHMPMREILEQLPLQKNIGEALDSRSGVLGELLQAVSCGESAGELIDAETIFSRHGISPTHHALSQAAAFHWASQINPD